QVAQWLVPPEYDYIEVSPENNIILAQQGFDHHIWDMNSKCLAKIMYMTFLLKSVSTSWDTTSSQPGSSDLTFQTKTCYTLFTRNS
ncbi:MAG: hypothetical protein IIT44_00845, partial [Erysipelotrichaceae bacterium]|nr:hypothetical protein [Erysipelotrichaceae bacterium]